MTSRSVPLSFTLGVEARFSPTIVIWPWPTVKSTVALIT
jgi:hypothetical protein